MFRAFVRFVPLRAVQHRGLLTRGAQWSVSDVISWSQSPFAAWMDRLCRDNDRDEHEWCVQKDKPDEFAQLLSEKGNEWEEECLARITQERTDVEYQLRVKDELLSGAVDFLVATDCGLEVWDSKLSTKAKPTHILQLCCYADMLERNGYEISNTAKVVLKGSDEIVDLPTFMPVWRRARRKFEEFTEKYEQGGEIPRPRPNVNHGRWNTLAQELLKDDVSSVYGTTKKTRQKLRAAGIHTIDQLIEAPSSVKGVRYDILKRLKRQARLQKNDPYGYEVLEETAMKLPEHSPHDIFFDLEGDPFLKLDYLWGYVTSSRYEALWAHDSNEESKVLTRCLEVFEASSSRRGKCYHYGAYEMTALRRVAVGSPDEERVEDLVRSGYFVDLYPLVKKSIVIGQPKYSLKNVEKLYREEGREGIENAASSVVGYEAYLCTGRNPEILQEIQAYNEDDCVSTMQLAHWLRDKLGTITESDVEVRDEEKLSEDDGSSLSELSSGWSLYHRRENRPMWRQKFEWLESTPTQLADIEKCLGLCTFETVEDPPAKSKVRRKTFSFSFPQQPCSLAEGDRVVVRDDEDFESTVSGDIVSIDKSSVSILSSKSPGNKCSMIPDAFVNPEPLPTRIAENVRCMSPALVDFVERRDPNIPDFDPETENIPETIAMMESTTVAIQGPPGTGKTYCCANVVKHLASLGYKVAITAPSHSTVENLLCQLDSAQAELHKIGGSGIPRANTLGIELHDRMTEKLANKVRDASSAVVVGGTAWAMAHQHSIGLYDFLFVDEAGQFPSANLAAVAGCSRNIVLVGDHAQLPAPTKALHPGMSGASCLDHLLHRRDYPKIFLATTRRLHPNVCKAISDLFYEGRLVAHPSTSQYVLRDLATGEGMVRAESGLVFAEIVDEDATIATANAAEAEAVSTLIEDMIATKSFQGNQLTQQDFLVVSPYNNHVRAIESALERRRLESVRVGTVDRFQGKQAPVVIASMCVSSSDEQLDDEEDSTGVRGLSFVLDKRRLNVAISRAQALAVVVASPYVADSSYTTVESMRKVAMFARLKEFASQTISL